MKAKIYLKNIVGLLNELADKNYQEKVWLYKPHKYSTVMSISFIEAANMLFDDCVVKDYLDEGKIILDHKVTQALQELHDAVAAVNEFRPDQEIIDDPLMEIVRQKAAETLRLIAVSNLEGNTVRIVEPGEA